MTTTDHFIFSDNSSHISACRFSASGKVIFVNKAFCNLVGKNREELIDKSFLRIIPQKYYTLIDVQMSSLTPDSPSVTLECNIEPSKDQIINIQMIFHAQYNDRGAINEVQVICQDITPLRAAEKRMRRLLETEHVTSAISSSFINIRPESVMGEIDSALHLIGEFIAADRCSVLELKNDSVLKVTNEWCSPGTNSATAQRQQIHLDGFPWASERLTNNGVVKIDFAGRDEQEANSIKIWLESEDIHSILLVPMSYNDKLAGAVAFESTSSEGQWDHEQIKSLRTISDIFVNAKARIRAESEIENQRKLLVQADRLSSLGTLVAGVAHEINNPTSLITSSAPILNDIWHDITPILENHYRTNGDFEIAGINFSEVKDEIPALCDNILSGGERIKNIVLDLKDYAREKEQSALSEVDVNKLVTTSVSFTKKTVNQFTPILHVSRDEKTPVIHGSDQRLQQVLINLIVNAAQSLSEPSEAVTISTASENDKVLIIVEDDGCGIAEEDMARIFDPFFTRKGNNGGTGLGLSISHTIITEHNGTLEYFSTLGEGTKAVITLPAVPPC